MQKNPINPKNTCIAIVSVKRLGDALLLLIFANNLQRNGYKVTFFSDYIFHMRSWFPDIEIKSYPEKEELEEVLDRYEQVFIEVSGVKEDYYITQHPGYAKKYIFITKSNRISPKLKNKYTAIIGKLGGQVSKVKKMTFFCQDVLRLNNVVKENGIIPLPNLIYRQYPKRIVIHPEGSKANKIWPAHKFLKLARVLKKHGWAPIFCVSQQEWPRWNTIVKNEFFLLKFPTMNKLASFIYESGFFIGNDSGPGHLASCLRIPTLTILRKSSYITWRPDWFMGDVVMPLFKFPFHHSKHWHYLISVRRVMSSFKRLLNLANLLLNKEVGKIV